MEEQSVQGPAILVLGQRGLLGIDTPGTSARLIFQHATKSDVDRDNSLDDGQEAVSKIPSSPVTLASGEHGHARVVDVLGYGGRISTEVHYLTLENPEDRRRVSSYATGPAALPVPRSRHVLQASRFSNLTVYKHNCIIIATQSMIMPAYFLDAQADDVTVAASADVACPVSLSLPSSPSSSKLSSAHSLRFLQVSHSLFVGFRWLPTYIQRSGGHLTAGSWESQLASFLMSSKHILQLLHLR